MEADDCGNRGWHGGDDVVAADYDLNGSGDCYDHDHDAGEKPWPNKLTLREVTVAPCLYTVMDAPEECVMTT